MRIQIARKGKMNKSLKAFLGYIIFKVKSDFITLYFFRYSSAKSYKDHVKNKESVSFCGWNLFLFLKKCIMFWKKETAWRSFYLSLKNIIVNGDSEVYKVKNQNYMDRWKLGITTKRRLTK
jgi:hypothetical protein